jgi:hypothetical protein
MRKADDVTAGLFVGIELQQTARGRFLQEAVEGTKAVVGFVEAGAAAF